MSKNETRRALAPSTPLTSSGKYFRQKACWKCAKDITGSQNQTRYCPGCRPVQRVKNKRGMPLNADGMLAKPCKRCAVVMMLKPRQVTRLYCDPCVHQNGLARERSAKARHHLKDPKRCKQCRGCAWLRPRDGACSCGRIFVRNGKICPTCCNITDRRPRQGRCTCGEFWEAEVIQVESYRGPGLWEWIRI